MCFRPCSHPARMQHSSIPLLVPSLCFPRAPPAALRLLLLSVVYSGACRPLQIS